MGILSPQQFSDAAQRWSACRSDMVIIKKLFQQNSVFNLYKTQIDSIKNHNNNDDFCVQIGVTVNDELIMVPVPLNDRGYPVSLNEYQFSPFQTLSNDLCLTEKLTYTVIKKSVLSADMKKKDSDSDVFLPLFNKPVLQQEKALDAIESWQNNAFDWFYSEQKNQGAEIFTKFYVPKEKIFQVEEGVMFFSVFGLKFSEIYQKALPALIFISAPENLSNHSTAVESNTVDFAKPCPPNGQIFDLG
ncbi:hypothetical protein ASG31_12555 [Chryseobacterium sp. Leaf404]|uniref:hypothetical protein n=1 Tax=unclassified Chryseobacterium TaxID=2593645 RepID=UPI000701AE46|nr:MULTISPECIES: hypothetical protein [unclassified Chryseobacterium]KQT16342.1 hypothetical protein ASG31_12555 [Chryseobacterium sp. Leaf404]